MNALTLRGIVAEELGSLRLHVIGKCGGLGELRKTSWTRELPGFGTRHYASGRKVYIVQARMEGRTRTVTIGNAKVLSRPQAMDVARRVLLRAQTGENPAEERKRLRKVPSYRDFLKTYWDRVSPKWKPSTLYTHRYYKRKYLDRAFEGLFLDEIEERHVQEWFNRISVHLATLKRHRQIGNHGTPVGQRRANRGLDGRNDRCHAYSSAVSSQDGGRMD